MTAGLAVGARQVGDACSEKCLQVTGAHGVGESKEEGSRGRAVGQGTQKSRLNASCWVCLALTRRTRSKRRKIPLHLSKKKKKKKLRRKVTRFMTSRVLSSPPAVGFFLYRHGNTHTHTAPRPARWQEGSGIEGLGRAE